MLHGAVNKTVTHVPVAAPQGTVLDWLRERKAGWLYGGLFSDVARLRPEAMFDADFLAAALYAVDRTGA